MVTEFGRLCKLGILFGRCPWIQEALGDTSRRIHTPRIGVSWVWYVVLSSIGQCITLVQSVGL